MKKLESLEKLLLQNLFYFLEIHDFYFSLGDKIFLMEEKKNPKQEDDVKINKFLRLLNFLKIFRPKKKNLTLEGDKGRKFLCFNIYRKKVLKLKKKKIYNNLAFFSKFYIEISKKKTSQFLKMERVFLNFQHQRRLKFLLHKKKKFYFFLFLKFDKKNFLSFSRKIFKLCLRYDAKQAKSNQNLFKLFHYKKFSKIFDTQNKSSDASIQFSINQVFSYFFSNELISLKELSHFCFLKKNLFYFEREKFFFLYEIFLKLFRLKNSLLLRSGILFLKCIKINFFSDKFIPKKSTRQKKKFPELNCYGDLFQFLNSFSLHFSHLKCPVQKIENDFSMILHPCNHLIPLALLKSVLFYKPFKYPNGVRLTDCLCCNSKKIFFKKYIIFV